MKKAFITGITGQDGSYLAEYLLEKGYEVHGLVRRSSRNPFERFSEDVRRVIAVHYGDMRDIGALQRAVAEADPDEIYNLAAQSDVGVSFKVPEETYEINYAGVGRLLEAALANRPKARIYQASTSEMFGSSPPPQNESTPFAPVSPYGEAKLRAHEDYVKGYRDRKGLYICSGILFNHESPRRGEHFVTRKITISLSRIKRGLQGSFQLGNLDAKRDWGYAGDYVKAMYLMLQVEKPDDYVIATGETHSVRDFVKAAAQALGMVLHFEGEGGAEVARDATGHTVLSVNPAFFRPHEVYNLRGDAAKARSQLGWKPDLSFEELVQMMVRADYDRCVQ